MAFKELFFHVLCLVYTTLVMFTVKRQLYTDVVTSPDVGNSLADLNKSMMFAVLITDVQNLVENVNYSVITNPLYTT